MLESFGHFFARVWNPWAARSFSPALQTCPKDQQIKLDDRFGARFHSLGNKVWSVLFFSFSLVDGAKSCHFTLRQTVNPNRLSVWPRPPVLRTAWKEAQFTQVQSTNNYTPIMIIIHNYPTVYIHFFTILNMRNLRQSCGNLLWFSGFYVFVSLLMFKC